MKGTHFHTSKTISHQPDFIHGFHSFTLIPNTKKVGVKAGRLLWVWVFLPLCVSHFVFRELLSLEWEVYVMIQIPVCVILFNTFYFFIRNQQSSQNLQLCIELNELCIKSERQVLHRQLLEHLKIQQLCWGEGEQNQLPAIRITGKKFPVLVIGCATASPWHNIQQSIEFTDYWLDTVSWKELQTLFFPLA